MYVCMSVCAYIYMYICMYVFNTMYVCMYAGTYVLVSWEAITSKEFTTVYIRKKGVSLSITG